MIHKWWICIILFLATWIVKNSWGSSWGKDGYIEFHKGHNECGLANEPILAYFNGEK